MTHERLRILTQDPNMTARLTALAESVNKDVPPRILLICPFNLFRQAVALLLNQTTLGPVADVATAHEAMERYFDDGTVELVVLVSCEHDPEEEVLITKLCSENPSINVVVLTPEFDAARMTACLNAGVDGYLAADMSLEGLVHSLQLVRAGEKVFPSQLAFALVAGTMEQDDGQNCGPLTARECEIMAVLARGESNKAIAQKFRITEATVKMHLRQMFAKIGVANRTQAATWAIDNGISIAA